MPPLLQQDALWTPQPGPQANAIAADWCPIIFYGGGKFSGKSDFLLGDYLQDIDRYREHWQGIIFRRALTEFTELKLRANELFPKIGGKWQEQKSQWIFPAYGNKDQCATLRFRYLDRLEEIRLYEGHSYPWIGVDELGDWEDSKAFFRLLTCNKYGRFPIPNKRIRATGNPGGRGHVWIKKYFVDPAPLGSKLLWDEELECNYMFILGTYRDNQIGMQNDPGYDKRMNRAGSKTLVKALKEGDFSVVAGAFFTEFDQRHIIPPYPIPGHNMRYMSMDWGSCGESDPFSIGWWGVSSGDDESGTIPYYKRGTKIRYREWYGADIEEKVSVDEVAEGIHLREGRKKVSKLEAIRLQSADPSIPIVFAPNGNCWVGGEHISYRVVGGDIKKKLDAKGPSIMEMFADNGIYFTRADQSRTPGWLKMRADLKGKDGVPDVFVFSTCTDSIEIIPAAQHSKVDPNDLEESNDHIPEEWRYGLMGRPYVSDKPAAELTQAEKFRPPTVDELWTMREQQMKEMR